MKIAILVEDHYQVLEAWYPYFRLQEEEFETVFVGTGQSVYKSKENYPLQEEMPISTVTASDFDGLIVPGGYAPDILRRYPQVNTLVKEMFEQGKLVAAICHGVWVLASAEIVRNKQVTCYPGIKDDLILSGAEYLDQAVVVDGNLITSRNVSDLPFFCREIVKFLKKEATGSNGDLAKLSRIKREFPLYTS